MFKSLLSVIIAFSLVLTSCTYDEIEYFDFQPQDTTVSYSLDIKPIIITYCLGTGNQHCHVTNTNQGSNGDFTTYAGLKAKVDNGSIEARVLNPLGGMPPSYSLSPQQLTDDEKSKLKKLD